jgi:hypothetical protein
MAVEGVAVVGFDLAVELERALAFAPPGDDYLVVRHPIQPDTGEIYTLRVQSVTVTSNVNVPVDAVNGTPVGQVTLDVVVDSDLTLVVQGLQSSFIPQRNLLFRSVIPLSWRGTATDLQPGVTVADFPAGFTNQRDRLTPRIVWAECPIGAPLLEGLPRGIRPPNRVPDRLPVATWPDEIVMAPAVPATLLTHVGIPGATFAPIARLIGIMASGVVQQALDLPRVLTESVARGGARLATLDFQGQHVYATAVPWRAAEVGNDPMVRTRRAWQALGPEWQPGANWSSPVRAYLSADLIRDGIALVFAGDEIRAAVTDGVTEALIQPVANGNRLISRVPWLVWRARQMGLDFNPNSPTLEQDLFDLHRLDVMLRASGRMLGGVAPAPDLVESARDFLRAARVDRWPRQGEIEVGQFFDPDVRIDEPAVSLHRRQDMIDALTTWVNDPSVPAEPDAPPGTTRREIPIIPPASPFFPEQDLAVRVRITAEGKYVGVESTVDLWFLPGVDPFLNGMLDTRSDVDIDKTWLGELLQFGLIVGASALVVGVVVAAPYLAPILVKVFAGATIVGVSALAWEWAYSSVTGDDSGLRFLEGLLAKSASFMAPSLYTALLGSAIPALPALGLVCGLSLTTYFVSLPLIDGWLIPTAENLVEGFANQFLEGLEAPVGLLAGLFTVAGDVDPTLASDGYLGARARAALGVDPASPVKRAILLLTEARFDPEDGVRLAFDLASAAAVANQPGAPGPVASGRFLFDPAVLAVGGGAPGTVTVDVTHRYAASTGAWEAVTLEPRVEGARTFRLLPQAQVPNGEYLRFDAPGLSAFETAGILRPAPLRFTADDFDSGAVRWAIHLPAEGRWIAGVTTPPVPVAAATADLVTARMDRALFEGARDVALADVEANWWANTINATLGQLTAFPAGSIQNTLGVALTAELTPFAGRLGVSPFALPGLLHFMTLGDVADGRWVGVLEAAVANRLDLSRDDENTLNRLRGRIAAYLADDALARVNAVGVERTTFEALERGTAPGGWMGRIPPVERLTVPEHFIRALPVGGVFEARVVGIRTTNDGVIDAWSDGNAMERWQVQTFVNWSIGFRLGLRGTFNLDGATSITLAPADDSGDAVTLYAVVAADLAAGSVPPGGMLAVDELLTGRFTFSYNLPDSVRRRSRDRDLRLRVTVRTASGDTATTDFTLPFQAVTVTLTPAGERIRDLAADQAARAMSEQAAGADFQGAMEALKRPDLGPAYTLEVARLLRGRKGLEQLIRKLPPPEPPPRRA